jgi:site-specific recombinase XerD
MRTKEPMARLVNEYLSYRRGLGYQLEHLEKELFQFANFAEMEGHHGPLTIDLQLRWATSSKTISRVYQAKKLNAVRQFAKYRALYEPATEIPPSKILGPVSDRKTPHIYSDGEFKLIVESIRSKMDWGSMMKETMISVLGLLVSTGLRPCEIFKLKDTDIDFELGLLRVRNTKFKKSRLVPIHSSTQAMLRKYQKIRDANDYPKTTEHFFVSSYNHGLGHETALVYWADLKKQIGWEKKRRRLHDFRHYPESRIMPGNVRGTKAHRRQLLNILIEFAA